MEAKKNKNNEVTAESNTSNNSYLLDNPVINVTKTDAELDAFRQQYGTKSGFDSTMERINQTPEELQKIMLTRNDLGLSTNENINGRYPNLISNSGAGDDIFDNQVGLYDSNTDKVGDNMFDDFVNEQASEFLPKPVRVNEKDWLSVGNQFLADLGYNKLRFNTIDDIKNFQRKLGFTGNAVDGKIGKNTINAYKKFINDGKVLNTNFGWNTPESSNTLSNGLEPGWSTKLPLFRKNNGRWEPNI